MERIGRILEHSLYRENLKRNKAEELDREFCRHDMGHFLDVARIGTILSLEEGETVDRELIYAAALLHDIGKNLQYTQGISHERASAQISCVILPECGFDEKETRVIIDAILSHRNIATAGEGGLKGLLYRADKASRACFACDVEQNCNWKDDRKNLQVKV